jgi:hypothetical protein
VHHVIFYFHPTNFLRTGLSSLNNSSLPSIHYAILPATSFYLYLVLTLKPFYQILTTTSISPMLSPNLIGKFFTKDSISNKLLFLNTSLVAVRDAVSYLYFLLSNSSRDTFSYNP